MDVWDCFCSSDESLRAKFCTLLLLLALAFSGCSFDDTGLRGPVSDDDTGDANIADAYNEVGPPDDASDAGDIGPGDTGDAGDTGDTGPGALCSETCTSDDDCSNGLCVTLPDGNFCTTICRPTGCPDGFECVPVTSVDGEAMDQCMPSSGVCTDCYDEDGDGYGLGELCTDTDCDDGDDSAYAGARESCDGTDNSCDGVVDEGCACDFNGSATGVCPAGISDSTGTCQAPAYYESDETSCDWLDNDCDGVVDEGCSCDYNNSTDGVCAGGGTIDANGDCSAPADYSATELCDGGIDNNCDGVVDEGCGCTEGDTQSCYTGPSGTAGVGQCEQGTQTCSSGSWGSCRGEVVPGAEVCGNNIDENCDGIVGENCPCDFNSSSDGVCANSTRDASGNCQQPADYVSDESGGSCDGLDNDCDGTTDEGCCSGVDANSAVRATSGCLTAGTGAESAIVLELVDSSGSPLNGANVTMSTTEGTLSAVSSSGNTYWAVLSPPSASGTPSATVTISAEDSCSGQSVQMSTQVSVAFAEPFSGTGGGADGCSADGNVRVRVIAADDGSPIANANVMVGDAEDTNAYVTTYNNTPTGANTGTTDASGYIEFKDFETALDAPLKVTAGASGHAYVTMVDADAADLVLALEEVAPVLDTRVFDGDFTSIDNSGDLDVGFMLGDVTIDQIIDFNLDTMLADDVCYQSGNLLVGDMNLPDNLYIPNQNLGGFVGSIDEKTYGSAPIGYGDRFLTGISGETTTSQASGDFVEVLSNLDFQKIGSRSETVDGSTATSGVDLDMTNNLTDNVDCTISNEPTDADVFCLMTGDWDSRNDASVVLGAGRLFLMGLRIADASAQTSPFTISNVSTVGRTGIFSDIQYMGASVAAYIDDAKTPPAGTENGASIIAKRDPSLVSASGGSLTFDDYIPIRPLTRNGRQFSAATLGGGSYPAAHFTQTTIRQEITETYSACGNNDSERTHYNTLWTVYTPGATGSYTLPTLPSGWPRAAEGGFIDVSSTPEDDVLNWMHMTIHEGLNGAFDYNAIRFDALRGNVTHASLNNAAF